MQEILLKHYHDIEAPLIVWSDNGAQFVSVVTEAVRNSWELDRAQFLREGHLK